MDREEIGKTTNWICTGGRAFPHLWQMCSLASGVESLLSMSNGGRNSVHRLYGLAGPRQWAGGQKGDWQGVDWLGWGDRGERRECEEGSDERRRSADWEGSGGRGSLPGGHGGGRRRFLRNVGSGAGSLELQVSLAAVGCCRAVWRQLAAAGPCKAVALAPLLMVLLLWNILSAIFKLCCFSSDSLQVAVSFCVVSNKNRNDTKLQFSVCILTRWCC